jgi:hypothetical protein
VAAPIELRFEATSRRNAVDLADALRRSGGQRVRVRPDAVRLLSRERWTVTAERRVPSG